MEFICLHKCTIENSKNLRNKKMCYVYFALL